MVAGEAAPRHVGVAVAFPAAAAGVALPLVLDEADHILQRITQKDPNLMGKFTGQAEPAGQLAEQVPGRRLHIVGKAFQIVPCAARLQQPRQRVRPVEIEQIGALAPAPLQDQQLQPQEAVERSERRRALERGLASLPDHHRQVLIMRELSGLSYQEIAQVLDLDLGTVKSRIARARLSLRKILLEDGNFFDSPASMEIERHRKE